MGLILSSPLAIVLYGFHMFKYLLSPSIHKVSKYSPFSLSEPSLAKCIDNFAEKWKCMENFKDTANQEKEKKTGVLNTLH